MRVAFVTYSGAPDLSLDDQAVLPHLQPVAAVWNDPHISWQDFDAVVLRSTWDYHLHQQAFLDWLDRLTHLGVQFLNPAALVRWNANKVYLRELQEKGIPIIPTCFLTHPERHLLPEVLAEMGFEGVVKPSVSAAAHHTYRISGSLPEGVQTALMNLPEDVDLLVQPFMPEIQNPGEHSLIFFNGRFSHAVLKTPSNGDFRVQGMHGGRFSGTEVSGDLIAQAQQVLTALPEIPLYARVDGLVRGGQFLLMEIELIEPHLFLRTHPDAARHFALALQEKVASPV